MAIELVTGTLGGGKTTYGVKRMYEAITRGKSVVTNVALVPDFPERVAREQWRAKFGNGDAWAESYRDRFLHTDSLEEVMSVRLDGSGEDRGVIVLDEAHNWLNSRMWSAEDRKDIVKWATQTRKLGFQVYLISQLPEAIDKQVRGVCEHETNVRNLRQFRPAGIPVIPVNYSLGITCWLHNKKQVMKRTGFRPGRFGRYFDSWALSHGIQALPDNCILLPHSTAARNAQFAAVAQGFNLVHDPAYGPYASLDANDADRAHETNL